jgi:multiple sugar transport system permease protein
MRRASTRLARLSWTAAAARHAALLVTSLFMLVPLVWMLSLSVKPPGEIFTATFALLPSHWSFANYDRALTESAIPRFLLNGVIVCSAILALQVGTCAPAAYALAKLRFPGREALFAVVLVALLVPHQVLALPLFVLCHWLGILDTYGALILPFAVSPFGIFLFRQFFKTIPDDVVHAARLDGVSEAGIVFTIMLPMALPAVIAFATISIAAHWNDLFWPLIAVNSEQLMPPPLGVMAFRNDERGSDFGPLMAGATLIVAPLVLAFLAAQRWFIDGLTTGATK